VRADGTIGFDRDDIDHPCIGFTADGGAIVGVDAFNGTSLFKVADYSLVAESPLPYGFESRFDGIVVGAHLLTECHPTDSTESSLRVLALPSLAEEARFDWSARGDFGRDDEDAGADLGPSLGADRFLEVKQGAADSWTLRLWRLDG
jgi:hypothetical protein